MSNLPYQIINGDSLEILKTLANDSVDSLVTDPPAGIGFMKLDWDSDYGGRDEWIAWLSSIMTECYRVLKPGAHGFVWAIPRTSHWTAMALENSGFIVRDVVTHVYGSGFPKSLAIDKAINKAKYTDMDLLYQVTAWIRERRDQLGLKNKDLDDIAGVKGGACHWTAKAQTAQPAIPTLERWEKLEKVLGPTPEWITKIIKPSHEEGEENPEAEKWKGWGTGLKPASEHWILIQKPIATHNVAANVLKHQTGALHIDAGRIASRSLIPEARNLKFKGGKFLWDSKVRSERVEYKPHVLGRHPANFVMTKSDNEVCPVIRLQDQSESAKDISQYFKIFEPEDQFFYCKKPPTSERGKTNNHPTVKPIRLMRYLSRLITPPNGVVLDPFLGSGTTGLAALEENFKFIGIEKNEEYFAIIQERINQLLQVKEEENGRTNDCCDEEKIKEEPTASGSCGLDRDIMPNAGSVDSTTGITTERAETSPQGLDQLSN